MTKYWDSAEELADLKASVKEAAELLRRALDTGFTGASEYGEDADAYDDVKRALSLLDVGA